MKEARYSLTQEQLNDLAAIAADIVPKNRKLRSVKIMRMFASQRRNSNPTAG